MQNHTAITNNLGVAFIILILLTSPIEATQSSSLSKAPELTSDSYTATAGFYHLKWQKDGLSNAVYELQEAPDAGFTQSTTIYRGPDQGTLISGRLDGQYFYRVRTLGQGEPASAWSSPITVTVRHHSLARALGFFAAGAAVFLATLGLIIFGAQQSKVRKSQSDATTFDN
jgi:hypothetical protein